MANIVVLGATGSVGSALAQTLVARGDQVWLLGRAPSTVDGAAGSGIIDISSSESVEAAIREAQTTLGEVNGIANCIGSVHLKPAHATSDAEFRETIETNLFSAFATVRAAGNLMRDGGSVVLFASAAAEIGISNHEAIAAAKAGVIGLARSAAASYAARNLRINVISPGLVKSKMTKRLWENPAAASIEMHALGRLGEPSQIASLAAWLLDPANDWITGQIIGVDGGLGSILPRKKS